MKDEENKVKKKNLIKKMLEEFKKVKADKARKSKIVRRLKIQKLNQGYNSHKVQS
ncbi:hypothetical protein HYD75_03925 [Mycoplasmopsis bovis]|nr:hypothetical protein [Mycoplasmopsis bovis]QQH49030.1 hypothetical protein HYD75_03925 [Mycoplasmopsis bovis]